ncbi:MAG TPA: flavodoxin-dependent (E)-4-hydroxy-3-methylbut-2-enyl-diphosphate synthase, partial [Victivallales bacterium]|nr:flavodoxin-dependent (E)-4-hydroxy-3-methylbut-2-enyl-diphosphate synthase [Victivallales bacterium]
KKYNYPLHLGITEAGTLRNGIIKSSIGIGTLLLDGIGNTIRVSLTANPIEEVITGIKILEAVKIRKACPEIISCPTCGRTEINLESLVKKVENEIYNLKKKGKCFKAAKIAIMGCAVNGPGEAKDSDIGLSGAKDGKLVIFRKGTIIDSSNEKTAFCVFKKLLKELIKT